MNIVVQKNIGAIVGLARAGAASTLTAGGAGDATAVPGVWIDRQAIGQTYAAGSLPLSAAVGIAYSAVLAAGKALAMALQVDTSPDNGTTVNSLQTVASAQVAASAAGGTVNGVASFAVSLTSAQRYVRFTWTPDLSNTTTDTAAIFPMVAFGGFDRLPTA